MKKFYPITFILFFTFLIFHSSTIQSQHCPVGAVPDLTYFNLNTAGTHPVYTLKIYFTIIRNDDGSGGYDPSRIPIIMEQLNSGFEFDGDSDIKFEFHCEDLFVNSSELIATNTDNAFWCRWFEPNVPKHNDGIDIFITKVADVGFSGRASGIPGNFIVLSGDDDVIESTSIIHEMGHLLGLHHMFLGCNQNPNIWSFLAQGVICNTIDPNTNTCGRNTDCPGSAVFLNCENAQGGVGTFISNSSECAETITNGDIAGDYIPDTPPSHFYIEADVLDFNCNYTNNLVHVNNVDGFTTLNGHPVPQILDPDGSYYNPDATNFMSITAAKECRDHFTPNQITVMQNHISSHPKLQAARVGIADEVCDCIDFDYIDVPVSTLLSELISQSRINSTSSNNVLFEVKENLIIDTDYTFENCEFRFAYDAKLEVNGATVSFTEDTQGNGCNFNTCDTYWKGIDLINSVASFDGSDIQDAEYGIRSNSPNFPPAVSLSLQNSNIHNCIVSGLYLNGNISVTEFSGNVFQSNPLGIISGNSDMVLELYAESNNRNIFVDNLTGIYINGSHAFIENNDFSQSVKAISIQNTGVVNVANNSILDSDIGISLRNTLGTFIFNNQIGTLGLPVQRGVDMDNVSLGNISYNDINSTIHGINGDLVNIEIDNNVIINQSITDENTGGIRLSMSSNSDIFDNDVKAIGGTYAIESILGNTNWIRDNEDINLSGSGMNNAGAIRLLGSMDEIVKSNWTDSNGTSKGIVAQNSGANTFDCNIVQNSTEALHVVSNSERQIISGNKFYSSTTDLQIESVIGKQEHLANEFRGGVALALGLSQVDLDQSQFLVNIALPFHLPTDPSTTAGWFFDEDESPYLCSEINLTHTSFPFFSDVVALCDYFTRIKTFSKSNPRLFFVKVYNILRYARLRGDVVIPSCITSDPVIQSLCGLAELVEINTKLSEVSEIGDQTNSTLKQGLVNTKNLVRIYNNESDRTAKDGLLTNIGTKLSLIEQPIKAEILKDSLSIDSLSNELTQLQCAEVLVSDWKTSVQLFIKHLKGKKFVASDILDVRDISMKCSDEYGGGVHLARAILNQYQDGIYYDVNDDCSVNTAAPRSYTHQINKDISNFSINPNPTFGRSLLTFDGRFSGTFEILDAQGKFVQKGKYSNANSINLDFNINNTGIYMIRVMHEGRSPQIKKLILTR